MRTLTAIDVPSLSFTYPVGAAAAGAACSVVLATATKGPASARPSTAPRRRRTPEIRCTLPPYQDFERFDRRRGDYGTFCSSDPERRRADVGEHARAAAGPAGVAHPSPVEDQAQ
jgi:hypothetical protein